VSSFDRSSEPESPPALMAPVTIWFVNRTVNFLPWLQPFWYWTFTLVLTEVILPVVKPVVRPLLRTGRLITGSCGVV